MKMPLKVKQFLLKRKKTFLFLSYILAAASGVFIVILLITDQIVANAASGKTYSEINSIPHREVGLLLGCSQYRSEGRINLFFKNRIEAGAALFKAGKLDCIIVSGDNNNVSYDEVSAMKKNLVSLGVPSERIYCDYAGFRTIDSIIRAKFIFGQTKLTVISQKFHNERALYLAAHKGIDAIAFNAEAVEDTSMFFREKLSRLKAFFDVSILGTEPRFYGPPVEIKKQHGTGAKSTITENSHPIL